MSGSEKKPAFIYQGVLFFAESHVYRHCKDEILMMTYFQCHEMIAKLNK